MSHSWCENEKSPKFSLKIAVFRLQILQFGIVYIQPMASQLMKLINRIKVQIVIQFLTFKLQNLLNIDSKSDKEQEVVFVGKFCLN